MSDLSRQRLFLRVMVWVALLALADGILEFCLSGAVHELALAIVMFLLLATMRWGLAAWPAGPICRSSLRNPNRRKPLLRTGPLWRRLSKAP